MFGSKLFGRGIYVKCVDLIPKAKCRLHVLKSSRRSIAKQSRDDVAELLKRADYLPAFDTAEQIYRDEKMAEIYDLLYDYCEVIMTNLSYISKHKHCPDHVNEAVSTLIYAAERFEELPELRPIGRILGDRYGDKFVLTAIQLRPGNHVKFSAQIKEVLNMKTVHDYVKYMVLKEIGRTYYKPEPIEYREEKVIESSRHLESNCEEEPVHVDVSGESLKFSEDPVKNSIILNLIDICRDYDDDSIYELVTSVAQSSEEDIKKILSPVSNHGILRQNQRSYNDEPVPSRKSLKISRAGRKKSMASQNNFERAIYYGYLASPESERKSDILKEHDNMRRKSVDTYYNLTKKIITKHDSQRRKSVDTRYNSTEDILKKRDNARRKSVNTRYNSTEDILKKRDNSRRKSVDSHYNSTEGILKKHDNVRRKSVDTRYSSPEDILRNRDNVRRKSVDTCYYSTEDILRKRHNERRKYVDTPDSTN